VWQPATATLQARVIWIYRHLRQHRAVV
jgi:hypothetical protein